ncbi:polysaccharide deacetylase family protein [Pelagibacteraceae bacterium]|nr:polysaccharide deacetylase family protein [Pelagibacteraceae bacterium]
MYHKFGIDKYPSTSVTLDQFDSHIVEFSKKKYSVKSVQFIIDTIINDGDLPVNTIGISVDDADKSFYEIGWPKFKENKMPVTLFVNTSTIHKNNKNYLNWDQIRELKKEGVFIGAHSHSHYHMSDLSIEEVRDEIETSNNIFLRELGEIPALFAFPYGEANEKIINLLKEYKFKVAFGQHSGVINETSNLYYLPRFSLNERYGEIDRVKFAANAKGLGIYDFIPSNPNISENPPFIGFSLLDEKLAQSIDCFVFDSKGQVEKEIFKFNERIEIRLNRKLTEGRSRINCTAKGNDGLWRWFGHQFYL